jgi:hypothetical protein
VGNPSTHIPTLTVYRFPLDVGGRPTGNPQNPTWRVLTGDEDAEDGGGGGGDVETKEVASYITILH